MDFDLRQWLLILGPVIIIGVLLHGYLRMRTGQNELKMQLDKSFVSQVDESSDVDDLSLLKAELPNGGARVISRHEQDDEIPVLVEPVDLPALSVSDLSDLSEDEQVPLRKASSADVVAEVPEMFVVINVLALAEPFHGQSLLEILLEGDMTYGEMDIFHRQVGYEVWFSLANAVEPGTFDIATMNTFTTPGVTMFMCVHELMEPARALDEMLAVANAIALELGGEVRDETRSVMTPQTIEHCRQSIREFQFKHTA